MNARKMGRGNSTRVFVYGTLLEGEPNHRLLVRAHFVAEAHTMPKYELRDFGAFPGLVRGGTQVVYGEVYEVDETTLAALDHLEGHPHFYQRSRLSLEGGEVAEGYLLKPEQAKGFAIINSGNWRAHRRGTKR